MCKTATGWLLLSFNSKLLGDLGELAPVHMSKWHQKIFFFTSCRVNHKSFSRFVEADGCSVTLDETSEFGIWLCKNL